MRSVYRLSVMCFVALDKTEQGIGGRSLRGQSNCVFLHRDSIFRPSLFLDKCPAWLSSFFSHGFQNCERLVLSKTRVTTFLAFVIPGRKSRDSRFSRHESNSLQEWVSDRRTFSFARARVFVAFLFRWTFTCLTKHCPEVPRAIPGRKVSVYARLRLRGRSRCRFSTD